MYRYTLELKNLLIKGLKNPKRGYQYLLDIVTHPQVYKTVNSVEGWISLRTAILLFDAVISNRNHTGDIVEVGAFKGLSTCCLSLAAKKVGKRVKSFELFSGLPTANPELDGFFRQNMFSSDVAEYEKNVRTYGCRDCVDLIIGDAKDNLNTIGDSGFSVAFIDTDVYQVTKDILLKLSLLAKGGELVIIHDYPSLGIQKAIKEFKLVCAYDCLVERIERNDLTIQYRLIPK